MVKNGLKMDDFIINSEPAFCLLFILVAIGYFGAGANTIRFAGKDISIYGKILSMLQDLLPDKATTWTKLRETIRKSDLQRKRLKEKLQDLRKHAPTCKWDPLDQEWQKAIGKCTLINERCLYLTKLLEELHSDNLNQEKIKKLEKEIADNLDRSQKKSTNYLKEYLADFISVNMRDQGEIRAILYDIGVPQSDDLTTESSPNVFSRCLLSGALAGLAYAIVSEFAAFPGVAAASESGITTRILHGVIGGSTLAIIFSALHNRLNKLPWVLFIGALGGFLSYLFFYFSQHGFDELIKYITGEKWEAFVGDISYGIIYGIAFSALLAAYDRWIRPKVKNLIIALLSLGVSGAVVTGLLFLRFGAPLLNLPEKHMYIVAAGSGFALLPLLAYGLGLLDNLLRKPESEYALDSGVSPEHAD